MKHECTTPPESQPSHPTSTPPTARGRRVYSFIHDVTPASPLTGDGCEKVLYGSRGVVFFHTYAAAAAAAWRAGLLSHAAAVRVASATRVGVWGQAATSVGVGVPHTAAGAGGERRQLEMRRRLENDLRAFVAGSPEELRGDMRGAWGMF